MIGSLFMSLLGVAIDAMLQCAIIDEKSQGQGRPTLVKGESLNKLNQAADKANQSVDAEAYYSPRGRKQQQGQGQGQGQGANTSVNPVVPATRQQF